VKKNEFLVLPKSMPHSYWEVTFSPFTIYWICFQGENSRVFLNRVPKGKFVFPVPMDDSKEIISVYERIFSRLEMGIPVETLTYSTLEFTSILGFSDCYYFSRVFKKVMGLSPRAYRKRREDHYLRRWADQYNLGIEPATSGMDSPEQAAKHSMATVLGAHSSLKWQLKISVRKLSHC